MVGLKKATAKAALATSIACADEVYAPRPCARVMTNEVDARAVHVMSCNTSVVLHQEIRILGQALNAGL